MFYETKRKRRRAAGESVEGRRFADWSAIGSAGQNFVEEWGLSTLDALEALDALREYFHHYRFYNGFRMVLPRLPHISRPHTLSSLITFRLHLHHNIAHPP